MFFNNIILPPPFVFGIAFASMWLNIFNNALRSIGLVL